MSGIAGIYYLDEKPVEWETLSRMVDRLVHRGPDGADVWCSESIGLGHRMLSTTPESLLEKLPLVSRSGDLAITADARIDNRDELIGLLRLKDYPAEKITDSQLILTAYEKWGESCSQYLLGDFAFAIWDRRKQTLFCGRDHFGVKPFYYYYCSGQIFVFASEIKALFCLNGSAIAFIGDRGWGKSTTAGALHARRHQLMSDDVTAIALNSSPIPIVIPGYGRLKLWPDAAQALGISPEKLPRLHPEFEKRDRAIGEGFSPKPLPLKSIYLKGSVEQHSASKLEQVQV